ncbi:hypothetical protein [Gaopeijia maritima]
MIRLLVLGAVFGWLALPPVGGAESAPPMCSMSSRLVPRPHHTVVLARSTGDSARAALHSFDWYDWAGDSFTPKPAPADSTWGLVFRVVAALDAPVDRGLRPGDEFVVVPWTYDAACHPEPWDDSLRAWVGAGEEVFLLDRRRRIVSERGLVFDVFGWHAPFPSARFLDFAADDEPREEWLPAATWFEFLRTYPAEGDPLARNRAFRGWRLSRPTDWAFPLTTLYRPGA